MQRYTKIFILNFTIVIMRNIKYLFVLILLWSTTCVAQFKSKVDSSSHKNKFDPSKIYYGGNIGLQFGTITLFDFSPLAGYKITEKFSAGLGMTYLYYSYKDQYIDFNTNVYGGRVFGRFYPTETLFLHSEYEMLNMETFDKFQSRTNVPSLMVGGGYRQPLGENSGAIIMILYNLLEGPYTPYTNPIIRMGFTVGI